jgi:mannose-6-phosphate isomerase-like protein (cupin superfamily)
MVKQVDHRGERCFEETSMSVIAAPASPTHEVGGTKFTSLATPSLGSARTSVWQVEIPAGEAPTPHEITDEEIFVVLEGAAAVTIDGEESAAGVGDAVVVPAGVPFVLANAGELALRLLCCMPVGGQAVLPGGEPFTPPWAL